LETSNGALEPLIARPPGAQAPLLPGQEQVWFDALVLESLYVASWPPVKDALRLASLGLDGARRDASGIYRYERMAGYVLATDPYAPSWSVPNMLSVITNLYKITLDVDRPSHWKGVTRRL
jgi:hypothetical protein